ncbi:MAG TPA: hypothetical protein PKU77_00755 [Ferruginibacter sp.]|nr:hypothetical protein [Ferruginibacter sp.]
MNIEINHTPTLFFIGGAMKVYSYEEIYEVMKFIAKVVDRYGDVYLPIFERVQKELKKADRRKSNLELVREIAKIDTG